MKLFYNAVNDNNYCTYIIPYTLLWVEVLCGGADAPIFTCKHVGLPLYTHV